IGRMIDTNDDILHCMCTSKLNDEAKRWNNLEKAPTSTYSPRRHSTYEHNKQYASLSNISDPLKSTSNSPSLTSRRPILPKPEPHRLSTNSSQRHQEANVKSYSFTQHDSQRRPCAVCQRINHRTIDCYYKTPYG
ncbi:unnamed protein product, partial [Rotaria sp. Silwood1]